jgi:hypothetical protein
MTVFVVTPFGTPPSASMWRTMPVPVATREVGAGSAAPARLEALPLPTTGAVRSRAFVRAGAILRGSWKRSRYQRLHNRTNVCTNVCTRSLRTNVCRNVCTNEHGLNGRRLKKRPLATGRCSPLCCFAGRFLRRSLSSQRIAPDPRWVTHVQRPSARNARTRRSHVVTAARISQRCMGMDSLRRDGRIPAAF